MGPIGQHQDNLLCLQHLLWRNSKSFKIIPFGGPSVGRPIWGHESKFSNGKCMWVSLKLYSLCPSVNLAVAKDKSMEEFP